MKILIIDDNQDIAQLLCKFITKKGHECALSNDGRNGLSMIENGKFDAVLLDLAMPGFTGQNVIDSLHKSGKIKNQKVVVFTASSATQEEIDGLIEKGAHSCLRKPVDPDRLVDYLDNIQ